MASRKLIQRLQPFAPYLLLALAITLVLVALLGFTLKRMDVPYAESGDALDKLVQIETVAETGWLFHNPRLGFPFGYDRLDFPRFDSLNYAVMGPLAAVTGSPGFAINFYYILSFYLIGFAALFAFRRLGLSLWVAGACALAYSVLPYHMFRSIWHVTNGAYFLVPLALLVLIYLAEGEPAGSLTRKSAAFAVGVAILLPLQTPYNGVFFAALGGICAAVAFANGYRRHAWFCIALLGLVLASFALEELPHYIHLWRVGKNPLIAARAPFEAQYYSLRLHQVLLPFEGHRWNLLSKAKHAFDVKIHVPSGEFKNQYIGIMGDLGFLALLWGLMRNPSASRGSNSLHRRIRVAALMMLGCILVAGSAGLCTIIAAEVTGKVRAWNRILPFLAFLCLFGAGWLLDGVARWLNGRWLKVAVLVGVSVLGILDLTSPTERIGRHQDVALYDQRDSYFHAVESRLGTGAAVLQLPFMSYPEHPPIHKIRDYDPFLPYLHTKTLRFSYGAVRGRTGYYRLQALETLPTHELVEQTRHFGYSAILLDGFGYEEDELGTRVKELSELLGEAPFNSPDGRYHLFRVKAGPGAPGLASRLPLDRTITFGTKGQGLLYLEQGWSRPESWGIWSGGRSASFTFSVPDDARTPVNMNLVFNVMLGPKVPSRRVMIRADGQVLSEMTVDLKQSHVSVDLPLPAAVLSADREVTVSFDVDPVVSPAQASGAKDHRKLGVGLLSMTLSSRAAVEPAAEESSRAAP